MTNCDDLFQQIQGLQAKRKGLSDALTLLSQVDEPPDPARTFVFRDKNGQQIEADFDEVWKQISRDPLAHQQWAELAAGRGDLPDGANGEFENLRQMVSRMGMTNATDLAAFMQKLTGDWAAVNTQDFAAVTAVNNKEVFLDQLQGAFDEARVSIGKDKISQLVATNVAPFLNILQRQSKLRVAGALTRQTLQESIDLLKEQISATGVRPTREAKAQFLDAYAKAIFAHRSERIASHRSGQLLQNYQRMVAEDNGVPGSLWQDTADEARAAADALAEETIAMTPAEMVKEGSIPRQVVEAADKGEAGIKDLEEIQLIFKIEGIDPTTNDPDKGWENIWRRSARAGYKDSILFNPRTQLVMNYLSQKVVFLAEGARKVAGENAWKLYEGRARGAQLDALGGDPVALKTARKQPIYVNPLATGFFRDALKDQLDGVRIAAEAGLRAEAIIKQSWSESLKRSFMGDEAPFAGNVDNFAAKGQMDLDTQYRAAQEVLDEPWDPKRFHFQLRDKIHIGLKVFANSKIEKATGQRLPVYSALQMMTAVDQRAGLRNFMTDRANDLMLEQASLNPGGTLKEWGDAADKALQDQLYQATPSEQNIKDARTQFSLSEEDLSDDEVAAYLAAEKIGLPVLATPDQVKSKDLSIAMRMQKQQTEGVTGAISKFADQARANEWVDSQLPFWRSPYNQLVWDVSMANPFTPISKVAQVAWNLPQGKVTPKLLAEAQASTIIWLSIAGAAYTMRENGLIVGNGPVDPTARRQWMTRLNTEGKVPNSVFGIPFNMGGIPVLNSIFMLVDAMDVIDQGNVSEYDRMNAWQGMAQVGAGTIMRMPGFRQVQMIYDAFSNGSENAIRKLSGWFLNGQANPASGVERFAEWASGTATTNLQRPRGFTGGDERWDLSQLPADHPLRGAYYGMQKWIYESNPGIAHWTGVPIKETTWLGRELRRPEGIFRGEWPIGVPGIWEFNKGDHRTETKLEQLGLLDPPRELMTGQLAGVPMLPDAEVEFNSYLGTVKPTSTYSRDPLGGYVVWSGEEAERKGPGGRPSGTVQERVDLTKLVDQAVQGRTVREALQFVFDSPQWRKWDSNPIFTTDTRVNDRPKDIIQRQPGPTVVRKVKEFYAQLAERKMEESNSPAAQQWKQDKATMGRDPAEVRPAQQWLQQTMR